MKNQTDHGFAVTGSQNLFNRYVKIYLKWFIVTMVFLFFIPSNVLAGGVGTIIVEDISRDTRGGAISAFLTPIDEGGYPVPGIAKKNVTIVMDNHRLQPTSIVPFKDPVYVVFLVDVSGTMQGPPIKNSKLFISQFAQQMNPKDRVSLVAFSDSTEVLLPPAPASEIFAYLEQLMAKGMRTELYRAIIDSLELTSEPNLPDRKIIVVLSDGKDESRSYSSQDVIDKAQKLRVPVYTVGFGRKYQEYQMNLERISSLTKGIFTEASIHPNFSDVGSLVHQQIMGQIKVTWKRKFGITKAQTASIEIKKDHYQKVVQIDLPEKRGIPLYILILAGVAVIVILVIIFFILRAKKKQFQAKEQELRAISQREAEEKQRRLLAEKEAEHAAREAEKIQEVVHGLAKEKQRVCKKCGRVMDPQWSECLFCKQEDERLQALKRNDVPVYKQTRLRFISGSKTGQMFTLPSYGELRIGADNGNDLVFSDRTVSGNHAKITIADNRYFIEDLESTNGTHIDGQRLASYYLHPLVDGQRIKMGEVEAVFEAE